MPSPVIAVAAVTAVCVVLDVVLLLWIGSGPPQGKSESFFLELVLIAGVAVSMAVAAVLYPDRTRTIIPVLFLILAWHTGFQASLSDRWPSVVSVFDVLIPLVLAAGLIGRWRAGSSIPQIETGLWKLYGVFALFAAWGLALGIARNVDTAAMIQNLKAFIIYPLLVPLLVWCIRSRRQFYVTLFVLGALITQRALDGILNQSSAAAASTPIALVAGRLVARTNGGFAAVNQYALYLMSGVLIVTAVAVAVRSWRTRAILGIALVVLLYALTLTLSRGVFLGVGVGILLLLVLVPWRQRLAIVLLTLAAFGGVEVLHPSTFSLVTGRLNFVDNSTNTRIDYLSLGKDVVQTYPLGAGWGAAFVESPHGLQADYNPDTDWPWYHDDYVQLATEISLAGLALFLWIWFYLCRLGLRAVRSLRGGLDAAILSGLLAAVLGMLIEAATDQIFWRSDIAPHVWIVAGLLLAGVSLASRGAGEAETPGHA